MKREFGRKRHKKVYFCLQRNKLNDMINRVKMGSVTKKESGLASIYKRITEEL